MRWKIISIWILDGLMILLRVNGNCNFVSYFSNTLLLISTLWVTSLFVISKSNTYQGNFNFNIVPSSKKQNSEDSD